MLVEWERQSATVPETVPSPENATWFEQQQNGLLGFL